MRPRPLAVVALAGLLSCATEKQAWSEVVPSRPEVLLEVLPPQAEVRQDGAVAGVGSVTLRLGAGSATVEVTAPGYEPRQLAVDPRTQAGARVGVALRPAGYGEGRPLAMEDGPGLAAASGWLLRAGKLDDALAYAERAVEVAPSAPAPRRALGLALARAGKRRRAAQELSQYLQLAPGASDRGEIQGLVEKLRGDISVPARGS